MMHAARRVVTRSVLLPASADEVWAWHMRPGALERLTPPWLPVQVVSRDPRGIVEGARVELRLRLGPLPLRWVAVHRGIDPGRSFRDEQLEGPFRRWIHTHRIEPHGADGCRLTDEIEYVPPLGPGLGVERELARMLAYRHRVLHDDLLAHGRHAARGRGPRHVAITGASGLVGRALAAFLTTGGHRVSRLVRHAASGPDEIAWDPASGRIDAHALEGVDAVVHLAGENLAGGRWTPERKQRLVASRTRSTTLLAETLARLERRPAALVSASAVGVYGDRGDEMLDEASAPGDDFLARLCLAWEAAADAARAAAIRVVHPRMGIVLSPAGGALGRMLPPFRLGAGGPIGNGRQWWSVVSIDDVVGMLLEAITNDELDGPANLVAPHPVTNAGFSRALGRALRRPAVVPVPAAALRLALGELADAALLASQRVLPRRMAATGYRVRHPTVDAALAHLLGVHGPADPGAHR